MLVVFDSATLLLALFPDAKPPTDPETGDPVEDARDRVQYLIEVLDADSATIIVPTPVMAEVLIKAGPMTSEIIGMVTSKSVFEVADFDLLAATEAAASMADAMRRGGLRADTVDAQVTKSKVKFDRQIAAIAKVKRAQRIYSDDGDLERLGKQIGIEVIKTRDLPHRPEDPQQSLDFDIE